MRFSLSGILRSRRNPNQVHADGSNAGSLNSNSLTTEENNDDLEGKPFIIQTVKPATTTETFYHRPGLLAFALVHEVRNPITNIKLAAEILEAGNLDEEQKLLIDIILRGSGRINELVINYLSSNKAEDIYSVPLSINELLDEVLAINEDRIRLKRVTVIKDYSVRNGNILGNKSELKIAFTNIVVNAIESMAGESGSLRIGTRISAGEYIIEIEDNGSGMPAKDLKKIFTPYYTNKPGGLGLGLTATMDIVTSNNGRIEVKSMERSGTRFILAFNKNSAV